MDSKQCPSCLALNPPEALTCGKCSAPLISGLDLFDVLTEIASRTVRKDPKAVKFCLNNEGSAYLPSPSSLGLIAPSSVGKTFVAIECSKFFPKRDVMLLGGLSPTALAHDYGEFVDEDGNSIQPLLNKLYDELDEAIIREKERKRQKGKSSPSSKTVAVAKTTGEGVKEGKPRDLKQKIAEITRKAFIKVVLENRIIILADAPNPDTLARLRPILSHDSWDMEYRFTDRIARGSPMRQVRVKLVGWPAAVLIAAKGEKRRSEWEQFVSRFTTIAPSMEKEKYRAGVELVAQRKGLPDPVFDKLLGGLSESQKWAREAILLVKKRLVELKENARKKVGKPDPNIFWFPFYKYIGKEFPAEEGRNMRDADRFMTALQMSSSFDVYARPILKVDGIENIIITRKDYERAVDLYFSDPAQRAEIFSGVPRLQLDFFFKVCVPLGKDGGKFRMKDMVALFPSKMGKTMSGDSIGRHYIPYLLNAGLLEREEDPEDKRGYVYRVLKEEVDVGNIGNYAQSGKADFFSLENLKEAWNELNKLSTQNPPSIVNYDGRTLSLEELFSLYYQKQDNSAGIYPSPSEAGNGKGEEKLAAFGKSQYLPVFPVDPSKEQWYALNSKVKYRYIAEGETCEFCRQSPVQVELSSDIIGEMPLKRCRKCLENMASELFAREETILCSHCKMPILRDQAWGYVGEKPVHEACYRGRET